MKIISILVFFIVAYIFAKILDVVYRSDPFAIDDDMDCGD